MTLDTVMGRSARWAAGGAIVGATLFLVEEPVDLLAVSLIHLSAVVVFGFVLALVVAPALDGVPPDRPPTTMARFARSASVVAIVTGTVLVVTLVSSAALGLEVSLQYLQLLSALDIAWVVAATFYGLRWRAGLGAGLGGAAIMAVVCVWSIWRYLATVGFTDSGGWLVDVDALNRLVFPFDVMAAAIALSVMWWGARHATEQRSPQS